MSRNSGSRPFATSFMAASGSRKGSGRADRAVNVGSTPPMPQRRLQARGLNHRDGIRRALHARDIPLIYLEKFAARRVSSADYFFGLYKRPIAVPARSYILCLNKHVFDPTAEINEAFVDMDYLFGRLITLLDAGVLRNLPVTVFAELARGDRQQRLPPHPEHRARAARTASAASHKLSALFPYPDGGKDTVDV